MPFINIDIARADVAFEANDDTSFTRFGTARIDTALIEMARELAVYPLTGEYAALPPATKSRIAQALAPWMYRNATCTVDGDGKLITSSVTTPALDTIISVHAGGIEFWNVKARHERYHPFAAKSVEPHLGVSANAYYLEPRGEYINFVSGEIILHYTPVQTTAILILVSDALKKALVYGAAAKLLAGEAPEKAVQLQERARAQLLGTAE